MDNRLGASPHPSAVSFSCALRGVSSWPFEHRQPPHPVAQLSLALGPRSGSFQRNYDGEGYFRTGKRCHSFDRPRTNEGENAQPIVHVLRARQQDVVLDRLLGRHLRTLVRRQVRSVRPVRGLRAVQAD